MQTEPKVNQNMKLAVEIFEEYGEIIRNAIRFRVNDKSIIDDIFRLKMPIGAIAW